MDMPHNNPPEGVTDKPSALLRTSHSALSDFLACPEKFRQGRILKRPETPAWWSAGGRAVHTLTEEWDRAHWEFRNPFPDGLDWDLRFREVLHSEVEAEEGKTGVPFAQWRSAGENSTKKPTEDGPWWLANGAKFAENWANWREQTPEWRIWETPDGKPGIELEFNLTDFGGAGFRAFLDRAMVNTRGEIAVIDLKAGSSTPELLDQMLIYAACMELEYGIRPQLGAFFNCRKGGPVYMERLDVEDTADTMERVSTFITQADAGEYLARPGEQCAFRCGYAEYCSAAKRLTSFWRKKAGI